MYIPSYFKQDHEQVLIGYMKEFPFGILVSAEDNIPWATHIPFVVEEENGAIVLYSHISAANPQTLQLPGATLLAIFREPHAYISPALYTHSKNVPTWNYIAVHAYGQAELITGKEELLQLQEKMIHMMEPTYLEQFKNLPEDYVDDLLKGITGFKMVITQIFGKEKLSQNKMDEEKDRIAHHLTESEDELAKKLGTYMQKNKG